MILMENKPVKRSFNRKLVAVSYTVSILTYLAGLYFVAEGYLAGFIGAIPTLIGGIYLISKDERRYGLVLVLFFFVWLFIYYDNMPR